MQKPIAPGKQPEHADEFALVDQSGGMITDEEVPRQRESRCRRKQPDGSRAEGASRMVGRQAALGLSKRL